MLSALRSLFYCFRFALVVWMLASLASCGNGDKALLYGEWRADRITQNGDSMRLDPAEVGFIFNENGTYVYHATLGYREAGRFRYDNGYLFAQDTTQPELPERVAAIDHLTMDTLLLLMRLDTAEREMMLIKQ